MQLQRNLDLFRDLDKDIARIMGTDSALRLVSPEYEVKQLEDMRRSIAYNPVRLSTYYINMDLEMPVDLAMTYHTLKRLFVEIKRDPEQFRLRIRVGMRDSKQAALYLDDGYLHNIGLTQRDIDYIARDIAQQLGHYFNESKGTTD